MIFDLICVVLFNLLTTAGKDYMEPPSMEGLDTLIAVSCLPCHSMRFLIETINFINHVVSSTDLQKTQCLTFNGQPEINGQ